MLLAYAPQSGLRDRTTTLGLEGIEDDNGLCYCISVPEFSSKSRPSSVVLLPCWTAAYVSIVSDFCLAFTLAGSCHRCLIDAINFAPSSQPPEP